MPHFDPSAPLLTANPVFRVQDRESLAGALAGSYRARAISLAEPAEPVFAMANRAQRDTVALHYCRYDSPVRIGFAHMSGFRQFFSLKGSGRVRVGGREMEIAPNLSGILPPDSDFEADYGRGYAHLVAQFDPGRLQSLLEAWDDYRGPLGDLPVMQTLQADKLRRLRRIALCLADQFEEGALRNDLVVAELEQALAAAFMHENWTRFSSGSTTPAAASSDVARLRDYVEAHWRQPLLVEEIAVACGMSVRSVFDRFKRDFQATPAAYVRRVRLQHAHRLLSDGGEKSVIEVALQCGFSSFGHFARRYREQFGELPSDTLERARLK